MIELFTMGGPLFMTVLTVLLISLLILVFRSILLPQTGEKGSGRSQIRQINTLGRLSLALGFLAMFIGLFSAFSHMETQAISQSMMAGGLKVTSIAPMYGLIIYAIAQIATFVILMKR